MGGLMKQRQFFAADSGSGDSEKDYLDRLAKSILSKPRATPPGRHASGAGQKEGREPEETRGGDDAQTQGVSPRTPTTGLHREEQSGGPAARGSHEWVRSVEFYDEAGRFIPGTILIFEDGSMGVYRAFNPDKDYDIVYQLQGDGTARPHGMPLYAYEVEPVGRISSSCLDQLVKSARWERDMIVFHLLKYKDRVHIPRIDQQGREGDEREVASSDNVSRWSVQKLAPEQLDPSAHHERETPGQEEKPALVRGRKFSISFGGQQRWDAIYWGKDELGHVVVHNTHDKWSLMHQDLNRFKETIVFGDMCSDEEIRRMEKDFASH